jgi:CDP-glycerol glycerophosphotransferase (TagB/SpsB family)
MKYSKIQFITGELHMKQFNDAIRYYGIDSKYFTVYKIGFPKLDEVLNNKLQKTDILKMRNLNLDRKTVLYAPSWDEGLSLKTFGVQIMESLSKLSDNFNIIIRPHPALLTSKKSKDFSLYTGGIDWHSFIADYKEIDNIHISTEVNSNYDLVCADLLVSDVSSITWDFLLLGKPVLLFSSEEYYSKFNRAFYREYGNDNLTLDELKNSDIINGGRKYAVLFNNLKELEEKVPEVLNDSSIDQIDLMSLKSQLVYNPGNAATYFLEVVSKYLFSPTKNS